MNLNVALVHDWLVGQRGGEYVLLEMAKLFPQAPIYTLVHKPGACHPLLEKHRIHTSFIQRLPYANTSFRRYLPLFPYAIERFDLSHYDLIISSSHCVAKGVITKPHQRHIAYIHTPMRYLWDQMPHYIPAHLLPLARYVVAPLRHWDVTSSQRPTQLIANSCYVANRIQTYWRRHADVVYPPVDVAFFSDITPVARRGFLVVSALVPYKRVDLAIAFANAHALPLHVIGSGPEAPKLHAQAGPTVIFSEKLSATALRDAYAQSLGLFFCGTEDFGIAPVEAMSAGCPVMALAEGGICETVKTSGDATGVLFQEANLEAMHVAFKQLMQGWEHGQWEAARFLQHVKTFAQHQFRQALTNMIYGESA